ncbi:MAG: response regulator [Cyclobacteriaceae bacterium]|nr:response regulator [Cyclobacteriaceae bacterium]
MEKGKVLIIDDEVDFGFLLNEFFSEKGYRVFVALTLKEGMEMLKNERPQFIFLDNILPGGYGWSKTDFIQTNYPESKLNLISAMEVPLTSSVSFKILYKPYIKDELDKLFV